LKEPKEMFDFLRSRGTALVAQVSDELMQNPAFLRAVETAYRGKERLNGAVGQALKTMNVPTRTEFKCAVARIEALERELAQSGRAAGSHAAPPRTPSAPAPRPKRRPAARRRKAPPSGGA
jgi:hypothetical protein